MKTKITEMIEAESDAKRFVRKHMKKKQSKRVYKTKTKKNPMNLLFSLRVANGLTQKELGDSLGCEQGTVSKYERDINKTPWRTMARARKEYGVDLNKLVDRGVM